jgi:two-component system NtrC family sensor kinase
LRKYGRKIIDYFNSLDEALDELPPEGRQLLKAQKKLFKIDGLLEDLPDLLAEAFDGIDRIKKIVQGMKSFARADSDTPSAVDINQCLENAVTIVWNEIKYNSTLERDLGVLPSINGFPQQLAQVFMNLLVNASHAIHEKGLIQLESRLEGARVVVRVHDNGAGIATANLAKIFDPFFTTKAPGKGTGLGMSIAREIIQKHGGTIEVESEVGKGTLFTVSLPVGDAQLAS